MKKLAAMLLLFYATYAEAQRIRVGSKHFTEGYILSEIVAQLLESEGFEVQRNYNLGGTLVCFEALRNNEIDIYPEYSGTIATEILRSQSLSYDQIAAELENRFQLSISKPYGFSNSYALVIRTETARALQLQTLSDLKKHANLKAGISYEFLKRQDGWDFLTQRYSLPQKPVGMEHGLAYKALREARIDLTDAYTTDGELAIHELTILEDDLKFFPQYDATSLYRGSLDTRAKKVISRLEGSISAKEMQTMNAAVLFEEKTFAQVAADFLLTKKLIDPTQKPEATRLNDVLQKSIRHILLTFAGLFLALLVAFPLAVMLYWKPRFSNTILYFTGLLQTIPSIALLAVMIPLVGIGITPAILALFLYALLPILRNTLSGLQTVDPLLKRVADGIGLNRKQKLLWIEFPLALPSVLAGIRTAAVINVGTATLAAFIGAGGLGEYIVTGLALNNTKLILTGAFPAAGLALVIELIFEWIERKMVPKHLKNN